MESATRLDRWANWAEIVASIAIVVSLVFLVQEVRYNTVILERQATLDRMEAFNAPFLDDSPLPSILSEIKAADGYEPLEAALVARYDLSYAEAVQWGRHLSLLWTVMEADYRANGRSPALEGVALALLAAPDNQLFWDQGAPQITSGEFRGYVAALRGGR